LQLTKTNIKVHFIKIFFFVLIVFFFHKTSIAQQYKEGVFGINVGIVVAFGTHFDRLGVALNSYYQIGSFQLNPELKLYFNAKNLGPNQKYLEGVASLGIVYGYGKKDTSNNFFYSPISNQTQKINSFGYAFHYYYNPIGTKQITGTFAIQINQYNIIAENDLFAKPELDRFRTGAFLFQYRKDNFQFGINATLFTGQMGQRVTDESYPSNHVYENTIGGKYCEFSHGLLSAQVQYAGNYFQIYQGSIGVDSERIRHLIQNKFIHDFNSLGNQINAHIPMLDEDGGQYLFKEGQKIKPMKFYFNGYSNPSIFY
jgi:hypothetical protein